VGKAVVAMVCGPHDEGQEAPKRRIDRAIQIALEFKLPLFVAGDAFEGREIALFVQRAREAGVETVVSAYDPRSCTLSDVQAIAWALKALDLKGIDHIHLVTDWWHMNRAATMLEGEVGKHLGHEVVAFRRPIASGPRPPDAVFVNERQGLADYISGIYGERRVEDPLEHRPRATPVMN